MKRSKTDHIPVSWILPSTYPCRRRPRRRHSASCSVMKKAWLAPNTHHSQKLDIYARTRVHHYHKISLYSDFLYLDLDRPLHLILVRDLFTFTSETGNQNQPLISGNQGWTHACRKLVSLSPLAYHSYRALFMSGESSNFSFLKKNFF